MTTGYFDKVLVDYCQSLELPLHITFINNPRYAETNYIYSIYCAREALRDDDLLLMHGDLVFEPSVLEEIMQQKQKLHEGILHPAAPPEGLQSRGGRRLRQGCGH